MLTMDQIYRIKNMRKFEGKSLRKISKITGHDFETVKKYVTKINFNYELRPKQRRQGKLSPYRDIVTTWLVKDQQAPHKQQHTARRVYDRLRELYGEAFDASERSVRKFVAGIREELQMNPKGFLPLEHPPGEAQADFGEARFIENGITYDGYYLNMSYPHSNGGHTQLFKSANQECLLEGMKAIFEHIGGVPTAIWFDNMSTAVRKVKEYGKRDLAQGFLRFMMHYGFQSNFCNPNSGHEKGSVENKVGYHRRNLFVPIPEFKELKEYNKELLLRCDRDMNRMHYKGHGRIEDLFREDKLECFKLPKVPFYVFLHEFAKADNYGKIKFDGRIYSTSPDMAGRQVTIKAGAYDIDLLDDDCRPIVRHRRLYGEEKEAMYWIPYLDLMSKRPTALKYSGLFNQLPGIMKEYLDQCDYERKKQSLKLLSRMTMTTGFDTAIEAFEEGIKLGARDPDSIWAVYCRLTTGTLPEPEVKLPNTVPELKKYTPNIKIYDELFVPGGLSS
ncbi:IS21 family transposase [Ruminiclostridium cellobioparum]|uniref:IS21 family transposase n=1 Tax=Ruminiclostridium cellobioparum TaxID=29355 RepID=UPI000485AD0E|nr:IS21 family transposase [Ruminiclostridium cellobioparum]